MLSLFYCQKALGKDKVRDHDHLTGKYRGAAHNSCNLEEGKKRTRHYTIPVFFHNLKGYDSHLEEISLPRQRRRSADKQN
eukprot:COSAG03_NODE_25918_length_262_cov_1.276074_1_plen_80_part_00